MTADGVPMTARETDASKDETAAAASNLTAMRSTESADAKTECPRPSSTGGTSKDGRTHLDAESLTYRLHTTVIELRLKWNGHHFVAVTNISFSICSRGRR